VLLLLFLPCNAAGGCRLTTAGGLARCSGRLQTIAFLCCRQQRPAKVGGLKELGQLDERAGCRIGRLKVALATMTAVVLALARLIVLNSHPDALLVIYGTDISHCSSGSAAHDDTGTNRGLWAALDSHDN
jgi:hypothetical protein